jgi:AraC-like DNA-binding protein
MRERLLFDGSLVGLAEFACAPDHELWTTVNVIDSPAPIVVFPYWTVGIRPEDARPVLATPNLAMLYNPAQPYERDLRDPRGDACVYVLLHAPAVEALEAEGGVIRDGRLTATHAPSDRGAYLNIHVLARRLRDAQADALLVEETALAAVRSVVASRLVRPTPRRSATAAEHHRLAESAKELIGTDPASAAGLHELALELDTSPFHLSRVFRRETGYSLHGYRTQLRLRLALHRLPDSNGELTSLAFDLGFASHSHFTDTFRREFGVSPSEVRRLLAA